jgi:hypothetical protein
MAARLLATLVAKAPSPSTLRNRAYDRSCRRISLIALGYG